MLGRVRVKAAKPAIPRFTKPPVQGELSLDKIKVVRNDLSDADLEVVAGQSADRSSELRAGFAEPIRRRGLRKAGAGE